VGNPPVEKPLSYVDLKYAVTVRQTFDFSCGAAALATMLTYYWGIPTTEIDVMNVLRSRYPGQDWKTLQDRGFSFDDLIWAAQKLGFEAQGAEISADQLAKLDGPVIVHLDKGKFQHFSVVRAAKTGHVFLSDPVVGTETMSLGEFEKQYTGDALAIWKSGTPLPKAALLGRPIAPLDPSLVIGGVNGTMAVPPNRMIGR
jgi:predicted double-glycine peptidase